MDDPLLLLVAIGVLSIVCQLVAHSIKLPAILLLLVCGITVGPVTGFINADRLLGDLLFPIVSLSVAIILFEGALTLKLSDISEHGNVVRNLCSLGTVITWMVASCAAHYALEFAWSLAFLFGAIVTVTGPTVIAPMLRVVRPSAKVDMILRWEGIVIDPIGALLAVLVFEFIISAQGALTHTLIAFAASVTSGTITGLGLGYLLGLALRHNILPHYLKNTAVLTLMLGSFALSNFFAHESGLLTVTLAGIVLANMKNVDVDDILEFKETLSVLLISGLFILLATRLNIESITAVSVGGVFVLLSLMCIARPASVFLSSIGSDLALKEKLLLSWIAPRGIIAAAVSALFALKLEEKGIPQAELLVPLVFFIIITTVVIQSITAKPLATLLSARLPEANGVLIFGGNRFGRMLAVELQKNDVPVCIADTNWDLIRQCRMDNIPVYFGNPASEHADRHLELAPYGNMLVLSPYQQLNPIVAMHFNYVMGKDKVKGLKLKEMSDRPSHQQNKEFVDSFDLFDESVTFGKVAGYIAKGAVIKSTTLSEAYSFEDYLKTYNERCVMLIAIEPNGRVHIDTSQSPITPLQNWKVLSLITPEE